MPNDTPSPLFNARVAYVYADLPTYSRVKKTLPILQELAREVHFIGTQREKSWGTDLPDGVTCQIHPTPIPNSLAGIPEVGRYMRFIRDTVRRIQPDVLIVVNEEYLLPFVVGYIEKPPVLILEVYDSLWMRVVKGGTWLRPIWRLVSLLSMLKADALIEVHQMRLPLYPYKPDAVTILHNAPPCVDKPPPPADLPVKKFIYVGGTIEDELMGIKPLHAALQRAPEVHLVVAGKPNGRFVEEVFLKHPRVHYIGVRPYEEVPGIVAASHGVYAYYSPSRINYIWAAPNKLYEAYQAGVPILMNKEMKITGQIKRLGCGLFSGYDDVETLANNLRTLWHHPEQFQQGGAKARQLFDREYVWDVVAPEKYRALFEQLGVRKVE